MLRWVKYTASIFLIVLAILIYAGWTPDIPHDVLAEKYATGASEFTDLPSGARAHYRLQGNKDGKTIVLLHGSNSSLHTWEPWVARLSEDNFIVTVDLPGHGLTGAVPGDDYTYGGMVKFLKEFTESVDLARFILGGNSMGGGVTLAYTLAYPDDVSGLVLVDAAGTRLPASAAGKIDHPLAFKLAGRWYSDWILENVTPRSIVEEGLSKSISVKKIITKSAVDRYWELVRHPGNRHATGLRFAWYRTEGSRDLPVENITQPALIIWGDEDSLIPVETGKLLHERMPNSDLRIFGGIGHLPMEEVPNKTAAIVATFAANLPGS